MTARRNGPRCAVCGRSCRYARQLCSTCRAAFHPALRLADLPARPEAVAR